MSSRPPSSALTPAATAAVTRWTRLWGLDGLAMRVTVEWSPRLRRAAGRAYPERAIVRLATWLRRGDERLVLQVLCHELAHIAVHERHGRRARPHGREWAALVRSAGFTPAARLDLRGTGLSPRPAAPRTSRSRAFYRHRCPVCQMERRTRLRVQRWLCRACVESGRDGRLVIERVASS